VLFASLNEVGFGVTWAAGFGGAAVEDVVLLEEVEFNSRDDTGFTKSFASAVAVFGAGFEAALGVEDVAGVEDTLGASTGVGVDRRPSASTIVIGIRRRFGAGFVRDTSTGTALDF
jgi:hypothetical protein